MSSMMNLCTPALVYFVLAIIGVIAAIMNKGIMSSIISLLFVLLWTWFLNYLCRKGHSGISWFLVLLPFILVILMFTLALETSSHVVKNVSTANMVESMQMRSYM
jgi:hypothetical protein|uniref:Uncharacterized protein n=1 Tax=viral metagenome TaxID=1070528 RepID=A0A6C0KQA7_9ZZZZ